MSVADVRTAPTRRPFTGRRVRFGDVSLQVVAGLASLGATVLVGLITWKVIDGALCGPFDAETWRGRQAQ